MSAECKESNGCKLMWDVSCNSALVDYSKDMRTASLPNSGNNYRFVRGPFWKRGRHIVNIKIIRKGRDSFGIGIIDKTFDICGKTHIGRTPHSYSYYGDGNMYHNSSSFMEKVDALKSGDVVTVDIDLNHRTLNFAVNGKFLTEEDTATNIPKQVAVAVNFLYKDDSVEIVQYYAM